ncbi:MAG TPA: helix-turn-helix transcriptional regulator [Actinophytocola sp.]|nr:helix-turn-helix transcriptional regulator [Actinophytocola sp.]
MAVEKDIGRLDVLVDKSSTVRVVEPPSDLNGQVDGECRRRFRPTRVQATFGDPVEQAAVGHVLGEHAWHVIELADVVAAADVRVQPQRHPVLGLPDEELLLLCGLEPLGLRTLHRQVDAPLQVPNPQHLPHPTHPSNLPHLVATLHDFADRPRRRSASRTHHRTTTCPPANKSGTLHGAAELKTQPWIAGALLKAFRVDAGLSQEQLGQKVFLRVTARAAQTKLASIENGDRSPHESELTALQTVLGITDPQLLALMRRMLENSSQRGRWGGHRAVYAENFRKYVDLEEDADLIRDVAVGLMPELLMCENYVRAIFEGRTETPELLEASVAARLARSALLDEDEEKRSFHFILCESAARKAPRGNRAVVREQIAHVVALSRRANIRVQVVPFIQSKDAVDLMLYPFTYLRIPAEGVAGSFEYVHIGAPDDRRFTDATSAGLGDDDARRFLMEISREYR